MEVECDNCGKTFNKAPYMVKRDNHNYCSRGCFYNSRDERKNGKEVECDYCGKEVYKTKTQLEKHNNHFCNQECANKFQAKDKLEFECKVCGKKFYWSKSRTKQTNPTYCSPECRYKDKNKLRKASTKGNKAQQNMKEPTSIELQGRQILDELDLEYQEQVNVNDKFIIDVYLPEYNLIIQWDGNYWHCHPEYDDPDSRQLKRKRIDKSQNAYFKECGYKILRFWGSEIRKEVSGESEYIKRKVQSETA